MSELCCGSTRVSFPSMKAGSQASFLGGSFLLARIAATTEANRPPTHLRELRQAASAQKPASTAEAIAAVVEHALETVPCAAVFVPTHTGTTARMISRYKPPVWVVGLSRESAVCQGLTFSYGVYPLDLPEEPDRWCDLARDWMHASGVDGATAMLVAGPSKRTPDANHRLEFMRVKD